MKLLPEVYLKAAEIVDRVNWFSCNAVQRAATNLLDMKPYQIYRAYVKIYSDLFRPVKCVPYEMPWLDGVIKDCWECKWWRVTALCLMAEIAKTETFDDREYGM